nr:histidinol-phosphate aminotransferase family protein [Bacteroidota bacterium]
MNIPTQRLFNIQTQMALLNRVESYLGEDDDEYNKIRDTIKKYKLRKVYKFDIGRNCDGFSPLIKEVMGQTDLLKEAVENLVDYPDNHYRLLTSYLSKLYGVKPDWFVVGAGLENMIDILARVFLSNSDKYLLPVPNFSLFEEFSSRTGATPIYVYLKKEDDYRWTSETTNDIVGSIKNLAPKIIWISNPINPTGQFIPHNIIEKIIKTADQYNCFVVVDEAYGEYTDKDDRFVTCYDFLEKYSNLLVLRTLSKIYGLPSIRIGYMVSKNRELDKAVSLYRQYFPFSWFSLFVGQISVVDQEYVANSRRKNTERKTKLFKHLDKIPSIEYLPSESSVFLLKSKTLTAEELINKLEPKGIFVANHNMITGLKGENFVRITVQNNENNEYLAATLKIF